MFGLIEEFLKERKTKQRDLWKEQEDDAREYHDTDYARIIHSASFRRLQGKTQILSLGDSDFYRTRLTHSLEVSQVAMGVVEQLRLKYDKSHSKYDKSRTEDSENCVDIEYFPPLKLISAIAASHDLGHPPFGHGGEVALNFCMKDSGGFEGNGQTLRILSKLENYSEENGANLARRTLLGCLKYPASFKELENNKLIPKQINSSILPTLIDHKVCKPPKCYLDTEKPVVKWLLKPFLKEDKETFQSFELEEGKHHKTKYHSFDCSIMNIADDISYAVHDFEDALALKLITKESIGKHVQNKEFEHFVTDFNNRYKKKIGYETLLGEFEGSERKQYIGLLVHYFLTNIDIKKRNIFTELLLDYQVVMKPEAETLLNSLKALVEVEVIFSPNVQQLEFKGQRMVIEVFEILKSDPKKYLPQDFRDRLKKDNKECVICDYIAGMTDSYLLKIYERLSSPRMGSVFDLVT